jgi:FkbM family methyltransferase
VALSPRLELLRSAFTNWRIPGYLGSLVYRVRPFSPSVFERLMDVSVVLRTRDGPSLAARLRDVNGPAEVFGAHEYAHPFLDWTRVSYVVDAGAHVGGFTLWAASRSACRILALEPNPEVRRLLEANVRRTGLVERVIISDRALAAHGGRRWLRPASDSAASALASEETGGDLPVETVGLADAIAGSGFPRVDLLKIDVEGAEYEVFAHLEPGTLDAVTYCVVECHPAAGVDQDAIQQLLRASGFEVDVVPKPNQLSLLVARRKAATSPR